MNRKLEFLLVHTFINLDDFQSYTTSKEYEFSVKLNNCNLQQIFISYS